MLFYIFFNASRKWGLLDPLPDLGAAFRERVDVLRIERLDALRDAPVESVGGEKRLEGLRRGGVAAGHPDPGPGQPADHLAERRILAPDPGQVRHAEIFKPRDVHFLGILSAMPQRRTVFFVSDGTGITAQMLGHSLLTQFEGVEFNQVTLPFVDNADRAQECLERIERESLRGSGQPIVFSSLVNGDVREVVRRANALFVDFFETFIGPLEAELGIKSSHTIGRSHSTMDKPEYQQRIEAVNFSMAHDDGASHRELSEADV